MIWSESAIFYSEAMARCTPLLKARKLYESEFASTWGRGEYIGCGTRVSIIRIEENQWTFHGSFFFVQLATRPQLSYLPWTMTSDGHWVTTTRSSTSWSWTEEQLVKCIRFTCQVRKLTDPCRCKISQLTRYAADDLINRRLSLGSSSALSTTLQRQILRMRSVQLRNFAASSDRNGL